MYLWKCALSLQVFLRIIECSHEDIKHPPLDLCQAQSPGLLLERRIIQFVLLNLRPQLPKHFSTEPRAPVKPLPVRNSSPFSSNYTAAFSLLFRFFFQHKINQCLCKTTHIALLIARRQNEEQHKASRTTKSINSSNKAPWGYGVFSISQNYVCLPCVAHGQYTLMAFCTCDDFPLCIPRY